MNIKEFEETPRSLQERRLRIRATGLTHRRMRNLLGVVRLSSQAISRNSNFPLLNLSYMVSDPTTKMCFYETAAWVISSVVSGASIEAEGPAGSTMDYLSPIEPSFATQVAYSMLGKKREDANDMLKCLLSRYEDKIEKAPLGKKYQEYSKLYEKIKKEMEDHGILEE